ncbi:NADP-dependent oxidoreductase domain-containing protein [Podospora aff. communis PSN243]|uniref:NADP-dependent oxidoreductase domain-containing protein n=1 Tax=Podospora aff. communis PSN243 TaxID=3040156 RepID=A0AAV9GVC2_9PEZI|nr:NADP-dependent oxidoreductase domain-containing protein [Podospora aff. communis PSN243]
MTVINGQEIGPIGYGLMGLTWRPEPTPYEKAFEAMREALANGMNFWNAAEFYGPPENNSLTLLEAYFAKYPEDADKVVLNVKGGLDLKTLHADGTRAGIRRSIDNCIRLLKGRKKIDVFECARRDQNVDMSETFAAIQEYIDQGLVGGIGLSEVRPDTIHAAVKITKVVCVELELSLWTTDILANGVAAACAQYSIPIVAFSPLGSGMLTGKIKSPADLPNPMLLTYPRFQPSVFHINLELVKQVEALAATKGCTPAQLAINWTRAIARRAGVPSIIPIPGATTVDRVKENARLVDITDAELDEIEQTLSKFEIKGERYPDYIATNT